MVMVVAATTAASNGKQQPPLHHGHHHHHHHRPSLPSFSPSRRRRSLTGPEMYEQWHACYEEGWHRKLAQLEVDETEADAALVGGETAGSSVILSAFASDPYLVEFARFHNSQLMQPMPGVERALRAIAGGM